MSELLNLIGCGRNINGLFFEKVCFSKNFSRLKVTYMFMALATSLVVLFYCLATADILTKLLQHCLLFYHLGNSQVSVYRTIGPTLVVKIGGFRVDVNREVKFFKNSKKKLVGRGGRVGGRVGGQDGCERRI